MNLMNEKKNRKFLFVNDFLFFFVPCEKEWKKKRHCQLRRMKRVADCVWGFSSLDMVPLSLYNGIATIA